MKLLLSSLLLASLCALSSWSTPVVTQSPDVSVMEGETVNISCCWTLESDRMRVTWLKNQTAVKTGLFNSQGSLQNCSNLTFTNITRDDSGRYICRVFMETPLLTNTEGNGTVITVRDNTNDDTAGGSTSNPLQFPVLISLAVVAPLLLIALVCLCTLSMRQGSAARVIYEVPHVDSEEAEMDKHSTSSSRGSSQWCQVPVYESFDYFERVDKESE